MLRLMIGKAGAGKTAAIINEIKRDMASAHGRALMIVPEQYSHEAERELCRVCGDRLSLYAEVLSFTGLARETAAKHGGGAEPWLDKGGRLLCMALALQSVGSRLRIYSAAQRRAELQALLLSAVDELKSACIGYDALMTAAASCPDSLGDKLSDLALILEAYDAAVANGHADPADRLTILARQIDENTNIDANVKIYVDGFIDFTRQEREILHAMLRRGAQLTVCLTVDALDGDNEIFELSRRAGRELLAYARELGAEAEIVTLSEQSAKVPELTVFADNMFSYSNDKYTPARDAIRLYRTESMAAECEQAAALCLEFVRDGGCRWRDIAVVARGFEDYRGSLESAFRHYGVPLFTARRDDLMSKPLPALIALAYEIVRGGWAVDDVISYMRTGLAGLAPAECDVLENYIFKWQLQGGAWHRSADWRQHPDGYGCEYTDETEETLRRVNALRRTLAAPLLAFEEATAKAQTAAQQAEALAGLFEALALPEQLSRRAGELAQLGDEKTAAEYRQLWDIVVSALEQCAAVLGDTAMDSGEFSRLFTLMLSKYDIGTIPVSLDRVSAGDFDRNRRRSIKHLIVLGASDQRLPRTDDEAGVFSPEERERLLEMQLELGAGGESELWREFSLIYTCLTMPSESLTMLCPVADTQGAELRPAFVFNRAKALFGLSVANASLSDARMSAPAPALGLAAQSMHGGDARARAAAEYFAEKDPVRYASLEAAANMSRGRLSSSAVEKLYGQRLRLSASRIDKFASCRFAYFCQYGLRAKPYEPAAFRPPEIGTFMHYVLEKTAREVKRRGGFAAVDDKTLRELCDRFTAQYVSEELNDFNEKSRRFVYLFNRLCGDVWRVVEDMAAELRRSDFEPLDFELDFSDVREMPPVELGGGEDSLVLSGIADRVDGWYHDGKLYLRVVDYKTGRKEFSMSDVWYGMGLQMLLYLFALEANGGGRYDCEVLPAGVMYVPARSRILSMPRDADEESVSAERAKEQRRSGLVREDAALIEAWERGDDKRYIPVKFRTGKPSADSLASAERLGLLDRHIKKTLAGMAKQLRQGSIAADPFYRGQQENACLNCDYFDACHFSDGENGESCRYTPKLSAEKVWALMEEGDANG